MIKKGFVLWVFFFISSNIFGQDIEIFSTEGKFILDNNLKLIVCNENITKYNNLIGVVSVNLNGTKAHFVDVPVELNYGTQYLVDLNSNIYKLYFTDLPLINIYASQEIQNEPKILADFLLTDNIKDTTILSKCGIEYRGGFSQSWSKKCYDIELWQDSSGNNTFHTSILNMRHDDDWLLLSMYNEP